ncbi:MAG: DUF1565 domain-containing protein, partial [Burkholderiales bacterium]
MNRHLVIVLFAALLVGESHAATLYVSSARAQGGEDGSEARPFRTITEALKNISPGDRLVIAPGIYPEALDFAKTRLNGGRDSL